ncbi:hypothetical protein BJX64DRAFT_246179 [Aspergillus heterothallicus]
MWWWWWCFSLTLVRAQAGRGAWREEEIMRNAYWLRMRIGRGDIMVKGRLFKETSTQRTERRFLKKSKLQKPPFLDF